MHSFDPCVCLRKDSVRRHSKSAHYLCAVELESCRLESEKDGGKRQAFNYRLHCKEKLCKGLCNAYIDWSNLKFLTTNYGSFVDTVQFMGCDCFKHPNQGENAKCKSQRITSEFLQVMACQIEKIQ